MALFSSAFSYIMQDVMGLLLWKVCLGGPWKQVEIGMVLWLGKEDDMDCGLPGAAGWTLVGFVSWEIVAEGQTSFHLHRHIDLLESAWKNPLVPILVAALDTV